MKQATLTTLADLPRPMIEAVPCEGCKTLTLMTGTRLCEGCWKASYFLDLPREVQERLRNYKEKKGG